MVLTILMHLNSKLKNN